MEITKEQFTKYEELRKEGLFNMFNVKAICEYTQLKREEVLFIMKHYKELKGGFNE